MKKIVLFLFIGLLMSCNQSINEADLQHLNGYWEIDEVELPDGEKKEYKVNETIDYFKIDVNKGFRTKVMPQLDGSYLNNDLKEDVQIVINDGEAIIQYKTKYATWSEEIIKLTKDDFVVKNQQDLVYYYKRPVKFSLK